MSSYSLVSARSCCAIALSVLLALPGAAALGAQPERGGGGGVILKQYDNDDDEHHDRRLDFGFTAVQSDGLHRQGRHVLPVRPAVLRAGVRQRWAGLHAIGSAAMKGATTASSTRNFAKLGTLGSACFQPGGVKC